MPSNRHIQQLLLTRKVYTNNEMTDLVTESEKTLAEQLRVLCYVSGREKEPKESANIIHKLALEYHQRSPDKVSLIRSAALYNAAIARKPENKAEVIHDLRALCSTILREAKASCPDFDLIAVAKTTKRKVKDMRSTAKRKLDAVTGIRHNVEGEKLRKLEIKKVLKVKKIQEDITNKYTSIMRETSQLCGEVLGSPPQAVKFALTGMGSLARKEISPFSDFENVIVLSEESKQLSEEKYKEVIQYFRWFAVVFQVILINLGETIVPSVAIPSLNDFQNPDQSWFYDAYTKCGISFDGMMPHACKMPLGRQESTAEKDFKTELIKPVSDMLEYLKTEEDLKNGYNLADILTKTCFVAGCRSVYDEFNDGVKKILAEQRDQGQEFIEQLGEQLNKDRIKFNVDEKIQPTYSQHWGDFNIKALMYRSVTIFVSALGKLYGIDSSSSFEIIKELAERSIIKEQDKHVLSYAVAVGCEIRLKVYMSMDSQCNFLDRTFCFDKKCMRVVKSIGGRSIIDFILIAHNFQKSLFPLTLTSTLSLNWEDDLETRAVLAFWLQLPRLAFSYCKKSLKEAVETKNYNYEKFRLGLVAMRLLDFFRRERKFFSAMEKELEIRKPHAVDMDEADEEVAVTLYRTAFVFKVAKKYDKAQVHFQQQLKILTRISDDVDTDFRVACSLYNIGMCLKRQKNYEEAQQNLLRSIEIRKNLRRLENDTAYNLYQLGQTERFCSQFASAKEHFEEALLIFKNITENIAVDLQVKACREEIKLCQKKSTKHAKIEANNVQKY